jgi:hypothetical protein
MKATLESARKNSPEKIAPWLLYLLGAHKEEWLREALRMPCSYGCPLTTCNLCGRKLH